MRDQHLSDWLLSQAISKELPDVSTLKIKDLSLPVSAFVKNAEQAHRLSIFPLMMYQLGARFQQVQMAACQFALNDPFFNLVEKEVTPEKLDEIDRLCHDMMSGKVKPSFQAGWTFSANIFSNYVDEDTRDIYDTLMSSQLVLGWTAFETLAGDLWEAAINTHCQSLVSRAWKGKPIPFESLRENAFNLTNKMGTVLRDRLENPFQSLKSIKKTYQDAFPEGHVSEDAFWEDKNISSVFHIRNLIVHRASIVDDKFRNDCKSDPRIVCPPIKERFYLDGKLLTELLTGLFTAANHMVQSVDGYIDRNM